MAKKTNLNTSIEKKVMAFSKQLKKLDINVSKLIVFGSQAKNQAKRWSDLDICVVSPQFGKDRQGERAKLMKIRTKSTRVIEPHPYHPDDLQDKWDPLAAEIRKHGVVIQ